MQRSKKQFVVKNLKRLEMLRRALLKRPNAISSPFFGYWLGCSVIASASYPELRLESVIAPAIYGGVEFKSLATFVDRHNNHLFIYMPHPSGHNRFSVFELNNFPAKLAEKAVDIYVNVIKANLGLSEAEAELI